MEYIILTIIVAFIAVYLVGRHIQQVEEDPVEHWEPPPETHVQHIHNKENQTDKK